MAADTPERRNIPYVDLPAQFARQRDVLMAVIEGVFARGVFIGGALVEKLEDALAGYLGVRHVVALNSGTDALELGLAAMGIGPGDEVITPPNSFVASTAAIVAAGATPVFADVRDDQNICPAAVAAAVTPRTRAIMPVHLTGRMADMDAIMAIAGRHDLGVIEDAAQSIGSRFSGRLAGTIGNVGAFSAHPLKNLNGAGDAGFLATDDEAIAAKVRRRRNHGLVDRDTVAEWGTVSRLDTMQAAVLLHRLGELDSVIERRRANAARYRALLAGTPVFHPACEAREFNTFHTFVVQLDDRDGARKHLADRGIGTAVHYPVPIHLQPAARRLGYAPGSMPNTERQAGRILTLPIHQHLADDDVDFVGRCLAEFASGSAGAARRSAGF